MPWHSEELRDIAITAIHDAERVGCGSTLHQTYVRGGWSLRPNCSLGHMATVLDGMPRSAKSTADGNRRTLRKVGSIYGLTPDEMLDIAEINDMTPSGQRKLRVIELLERIPVKEEC